MSWEDQGRQYHMWFGSGHAPPKLKTAAERAAAPAPDSLSAKLTAVAHGAIGALKQRSARAMAEAQLRNGVLPRLTEAMSLWASGSRMNALSFAHHFFDRDADDPVVTSRRRLGCGMATTQAELGTAATHLADAMTAVGLDHWQHFVAHTVERARDPRTLAAVTRSLQPAPKARAGNGTRLAQMVEEPTPPVEEEAPIPVPRVLPEVVAPETATGPGAKTPAEVVPAPPPAQATEAAPEEVRVRGDAKGGLPEAEATVSPQRRIHILDGDKTGGGHRPGTGITGKSEFPADWSDERIISEIESIANDPKSKRGAPDERGKVMVDGVRDGLEIRVIMNGQTIISAFPTNVQRNPKRR